MSLDLLTRADAVGAAMDEYDELGADAFLAKYGYGRARAYFVERDGKTYDSKAIAGVAVGKQQGDVYQMVAYAHVYDCSRLMLLYPHHDDLGSPAPVLLDHRIPSTSRRLSVATLSLTNLGAVEQSLVALVEACDLEN